MPEKHVLIVAPEGDEVAGLASYLTERGFPTEVASAEPEAVQMFQQGQHDVVLVDSELPGLALPDFVAAILKVRPATRIIVITRTERPSELYRAVEVGAACYARKPFDKEELFRQMEML